MAKAWLIGSGGFLAVLLIVSIILALQEQEVTLSEGTPEGVVQQYLAAVESEDFETAYGLFSSELREDCTLQDLAGSSLRFDDRLQRSRIVLDKATSLEDGAFVTVHVTEFSGRGAFGTSEWTHTEQFSLAREGEEWRFNKLPWPSFGCPRNSLEPPRPVTAATPEPKPTPTPESTETPEPAA